MKTKITQLIICASVGAIFQTQPVAQADEAKFDADGRQGTVAVTETRYEDVKTRLCNDRQPRQGLGAEDLTHNERRFQKPVAYGESHSVRHDIVVREKPMARIETRTDHLEATNSASSDPSPNLTVHERAVEHSNYDAVPRVTFDRTPRQGLGAEDLTRGSYASSDFVIRDPAGANNARFNYRNSSRHDGDLRSDSERQMEINRRQAEVDRPQKRLKVEGSTEKTPDTNP